MLDPGGASLGAAPPRSMHLRAWYPVCKATPIKEKNIMYDKNLNETIRLRLNNRDMDFLIDMATHMNVTVSECVRMIIGSYRRTIEKEKMFNGDTKTLINDIVQ